MKEYDLPSGAKLKINLAPFRKGNDLFVAVSEELKSLKVSKDDDLDIAIIKDLFFGLVASKKVEHAVYACLEKCLYNGMKINVDDTFEPEEARQDYYEAMFLVAKENLLPFMKALFAKYGHLLGGLGESQKLK